MNKKCAIILAAVSGIVCALATFLIMTLIRSADPFVEVSSLIQQKYLNGYDASAVRDAGLKAMVSELGDPYSAYYTPDEFKAYEQQVSGEYVGIGIVIKKDTETGEIIVDSFIEGSIAKEAGILEGDVLISVDGTDVAGKTLVQISELCGGKEGTAVEIGVRRGGETLKFEIMRKALARDMVTYRMLPDGIGYMKILQFGGNCEKLFGEAMDYFINYCAGGVVIDLRVVPGGYLDAVVRVLDRLLPEGSLVYTENRNKIRETYKSGASCIRIPLALVVNKNTASAAEIFAGAVQDFDYGKVVGTTTYGKGVVQEIIPVKSTGGGLKLTISQYFTPKGRIINGNGIYPDYYVGDARTADKDAQLEKALEVLKSMISAR